MLSFRKRKKSNHLQLVQAFFFTCFIYYLSSVFSHYYTLSLASFSPFSPSSSPMYHFSLLHPFPEFLFLLLLPFFFIFYSLSSSFLLLSNFFFILISHISLSSPSSSLLTLLSFVLQIRLHSLILFKCTTFILYYDLSIYAVIYMHIIYVSSLLLFYRILILCMRRIV